MIITATFEIRWTISCALVSFIQIYNVHKKFDAKARLTEITARDMIGLKNKDVSMTTNHRDKKFSLEFSAHVSYFKTDFF